MILAEQEDFYRCLDCGEEWQNYEDFLIDESHEVDGRPGVIVTIHNPTDQDIATPTETLMRIVDDEIKDAKLARKQKPKARN